MAIREKDGTADPVIIRLQGKSGLQISDNGGPLSEVVRSSLEVNRMLDEGRMTPSDAVHYFLAEGKLHEIFDSQPYRISVEMKREAESGAGLVEYGFTTEAGTDYYAALTWTPSPMEAGLFNGEFEFGTEAGGKSEKTGEHDVSRVVATAAKALADAVKNHAPGLGIVNVGGSGTSEDAKKRVRVYKAFISRNYPELEIESSRQGFNITNPSALA
jgi:hypothetical protein